MIKGVNRIRDFGVFSNYSKPTITEPFADRNIIYGWNYSGKTTLSRLFYCLETKARHPDFPNATFVIDDGSGNHLTEENLNSDGRIVRVFNTDFIDRNLKWDGSTFNPILLLGEDSIETEKKIAEQKERLKRCTDGYKKMQVSAASIDTSVADKKTKAAKQIKTTLRIVEAFTTVHLNNVLDAVKIAESENVLIAEERVQELLKLALSSDKDKLDIIQKIYLTPEIVNLSEKCKSVLAKKPTFFGTIDYLRDNPSIAKWVEDGLPLHNDAEMCEFCGNELNAERMDSFRAHFSKDLDNFRSELRAAISLISNARLAYDERGKGLFYIELRDQVTQANASLKLAVEAFNSELSKYSAALEKKLTAPFDETECPRILGNPENAVKSAVNNFNIIVEKNNQITTNYEKEKQIAITDLKKHYVAEFSQLEKLDSLEKKKGVHLRHRQRYQIFGEHINDVVANLEAKINQAQKGRKEINAHIANLFGESALRIEVVTVGQNDRFQIMRGGTVAKNLSEGEKTAFAFAFFLSKLSETKNFKDVIVYIDDPISSLDSNHIFQVNAIIRDIFFEQDDMDGGKWKTKCKQLFISTHNFEFLSLLKELPGGKKKNSQRFYQVKRLTPTESTFANLPESITKYQSEYHYLYSVIRDFHKSTDKGDIELLLAVPNAMRRFVELYTMSRLPNNNAVDERAEALFGALKAKRVVKVLHYFSHLNNIDRLMKNTDLICDIENAAADLLELIKTTDPHHLEALDESIA